MVSKTEAVLGLHIFGNVFFNSMFILKHVAQYPLTGKILNQFTIFIVVTPSVRICKDPSVDTSILNIF